MTVIAVLVVIAMVPAGIVLGIGNRSAVLGILVVGFLILSAINFFVGAPTSPSFYAAPAALAVLIGWSVGKRIQRRRSGK